MLPRILLSFLCLWLLLMAIAARDSLDWIDPENAMTPPLLLWLMHRFWMVQAIMGCGAILCVRTSGNLALTVFGVGQLLLWQAAVSIHVSAMSVGHTRVWVDGQEVPSHVNRSPK